MPLGIYNSRSTYKDTTQVQQETRSYSYVGTNHMLEVAHERGLPSAQSSPSLLALGQAPTHFLS